MIQTQAGHLWNNNQFFTSSESTCRIVLCSDRCQIMPLPEESQLWWWWWGWGGWGGWWWWRTLKTSMVTQHHYWQFGSLAVWQPCHWHGKYAGMKEQVSKSHFTAGLTQPWKMSCCGISKQSNQSNQKPFEKGGWIFSKEFFSEIICDLGIPRGEMDHHLILLLLLRLPPLHVLCWPFE